MDAAVSDSMLMIVAYCSVKTSYLASSSRFERTLYFLNDATVPFSMSHGSASGVVRRFSRPRFAASLCHASE